MGDVKDYCENTYKRLVGLKAGLYDVMTKAESVSDSVHSGAAKKMKSLLADIESGLDELTHQCPSDWSPNKKQLDDSMEELTKTLNLMADRLGVVIPDTTAWI